MMRFNDPTRGRAAGFTLIELSVVIAFVAVFAGLLLAILSTSTYVNRDTYVAQEVVDVGTRVSDQVAGLLSQASRYYRTTGTGPPLPPPVMVPQPASDRTGSTAGQRIAFQHSWDAEPVGLPFANQGRSPDMTQNFGIFLNGQQQPQFWRENWSCELIWVGQGPAINEASFGGFAGGIDIDEVEPQTNTVQDMGVLEVRYLDPNGTVVQRTFIGGGAVRIARTVFYDAPLSNPAGVTVGDSDTTRNNPVCLFSMPPVLDVTGALVEQRHHPLICPPYEAPAVGFYTGPQTYPFWDNYPSALNLPTGRITEMPQAVQVNLKVCYNPVPSNGGAGATRDLHTFTINRVVTRRTQGQ